MEEGCGGGGGGGVGGGGGIDKTCNKLHGAQHDTWHS